MIVEGILILANPELRALFDVKIFVHADSDERLIRRLKRDIAGTVIDMDENCQSIPKHIKTYHQQFIEPTKLLLISLYQTTNTIQLQLM
jgi:uridine kinase